MLILAQFAQIIGLVSRMTEMTCDGETSVARVKCGTERFDGLVFEQTSEKFPRGAILLSVAAFRGL